MIEALITDVSYVLLFPKDKNYKGILNKLYIENRNTENYRFFDHFSLNVTLLDYYKSLKDKVLLYIFTSDIIQEDIKLKSHIDTVFNGVFSASKMGVHKSDIKAYQKLISSIGTPPDQALFIDDKKININSADKAGLNTILYINNDSLVNKVNEALSI